MLCHTWAVGGDSPPLKVKPFVVRYQIQNFLMYRVPPLKPRIGLLLAHICVASFDTIVELFFKKTYSTYVIKPNLPTKKTFITSCSMMRQFYVAFRFDCPLLHAHLDLTHVIAQVSSSFLLPTQNFTIDP